MNKKILLLATLCAFAILTAQAQSAIVPTGGTASGNGGTVTYTVGQIATQTNSDGTTSISEGVQQPYEISVVGVDNYPNITLNAVLYPNPTQGNLQLVMNNGQFAMNNGKWQIKMFDTNGKYLLSKKIDSETTEFDISSYAPGTYYVNVYRETEMMKTFKVVKMSR